MADLLKYPERPGSHSQAVGRACDVTCWRLDSDSSERSAEIDVCFSGLQLYVQKVLCSEGPMFRRFYVQKVLCSEGSK